MADERFVLLAPGAARPGRIPLPPAFRVKAATEDTGGRFSLLEVVLGRDIPRHTHHRADEGVYVLDGVLEIEFDDAVHLAPRGSFVLLPHGVPHALRRASDPPPRVLQISSPGGWELYARWLGALPGGPVRGGAHRAHRRAAGSREDQSDRGALRHRLRGDTTGRADTRGLASRHHG
ncbi:cupin domain-containing protein [Streptomyces sp. MBT62]|uniref:cupin domain-containing protein n=1 Tax=Streptomyces sp. MBT62 TaxID=2800410 RepID=UPI001F230E47|nr:cupin domain-containing protein [Streptomyces sp. MBT62]